MKNIIKISVISVIAIVLLLSIGKNLNLTVSNNLLAEFINNVFRNEEKDRENITANSTEIVNNVVDDKAVSLNTENKDKLSSSINITDNEENRIFAEISKQQYGIKVVTQNDIIETAYNRYTINKISTSKKLGDFNYSDDLGHVDKDGNAIDGYSYFIVNTSLECLDVDEEIGGFYLNTIDILAYKDTIQQTGYEMLTSNNDVPMSNKSAFKVKMKKGEKRDFNLVFLVEDKFINDKGVDFYLDINDRGASPGSDDENIRIVKLDYVRKADYENYLY